MPGSGKEFQEVATVTQVVWDLFEDILHPHTRFYASILAGTYQRVHYRCAICGGIIAAEEHSYIWGQVTDDVLAVVRAFLALLLD